MTVALWREAPPICAQRTVAADLRMFGGERSAVIDRRYNLNRFLAGIRYLRRSSFSREVFDIARSALTWGL